MNRLKKYPLFFVAMILLLIASCTPFPHEHTADCSSTEGSYVCFDGDGRPANYGRWNFDTIETFNAFNIQGSYLPIPGTEGPWTTVNLSFVNSNGSMAMETGTYTYVDFLTNAGQRQFTFWIKRYYNDAQNPDIVNFEANPGGISTLTISGMDGSFNLSGLFEGNVWNMADSTETSIIKYRFTDIPIQ